MRHSTGRGRARFWSVSFPLAAAVTAAAAWWRFNQRCWRAAYGPDGRHLHLVAPDEDPEA